MKKGRSLGSSAIQCASTQYHRYFEFVGSSAEVDLSADNPILQAALSHDKRPVCEPMLSIRDAAGRCVSHYLAWIYGVRGLRLLANAKLEALHALDHHGLTPLHYAAFSAQKLFARYLTELKLDVYAENDFGHSAPVTAVIVGHTQFDQACDQLTLPANVELHRLHWRAAYCNIKFSDFDVLREAITSQNQNPLMTNFRDEHGATLLHLACLHGHIELVRFLLQCRVNVMARDMHGQVPLDLAIARVDLVKNKGNKQGQSEWHQYLVEQGLVIVDLLLKQQLSRSKEALQRQLDVDYVKNNDALALLLKWNGWWYQQKYDVDYRYIHFSGHEVLEDTCWNNTLFGKPRQAIEQELKALVLSESEFSYREKFAVELIYQMREVLTTSIRSSVFLSVQFKFGVYSEVYAAILQRLTEIVELDARGDLAELKNQMAPDPYRFFYQRMFKGEEGIIAQIKRVVFQSNDVPNCLLMEWAVVMQKILKQCIQLDNELKTVPGYLPAKT